MKTKQKQNWILKFAAIALMITLISTCLLGSTLAKYVTSGTGNDSARVAKWGVVVTASQEGAAFKTEYTPDDSNTAVSLAVESSTTERVIAPGTDGKFEFSIKGEPEVAVQVNVEMIGTATGWVLEDGNTYEPIKWTLTKFDGVSTDTLVSDGSYAELFTAINELSDNYEPGTDLSAKYGEYTITWDWTFSTDNVNDIKDTYLGNVAAGFGSGTVPTIDFNLDITVTQID